MANTYRADLERASTQYAYVLNDLGITGGNITVEGWITVEDAPTSGQSFAIFQQQDAGVSVSYDLYYENSAGTLRWNVERIKHAVANQNAQFNVDLGTSCIHFAVVYDGTNLKLYTAPAAGTHTERATVAASGNGAATNNDHFSIAVAQTADSGTWTPDTATPFDGTLDDIRVWNTNSSVANLDDNFEKELVGNETNLVAYYKLNNDWTDATANAFNLTTNGTPTFLSTGLCFSGAVAAGRFGSFLIMGVGT